MKAPSPELFLHGLDVGVRGGHDGHDQDLARGEPERPLAGEVLAQDCDEAFEAAEDCAVDHYRAGAAGGEGFAVVFLGCFGVGGVGDVGWD